MSSGLYFRKICLCYIFIDLCGLGRRFLLLYSCRRLGSSWVDSFLRLPEEDFFKENYVSEIFGL